VPGISWVYWGPWHLYYKPLSPRFFFFFVHSLWRCKLQKWEAPIRGE
jgi:hypothetical protein